MACLLASFGGFLRPKGPKFEAKGRQRAGVLGRGSEPVPPDRESGGAL